MKTNQPVTPLPDKATSVSAYLRSQGVVDDEPSIMPATPVVIDWDAVQADEDADYAGGFGDDYFIPGQSDEDAN